MGEFSTDSSSGSESSSQFGSDGYATCSQNNLVSRKKWTRESRNVRVDDFVIVGDSMEGHHHQQYIKCKMVKQTLEWFSIVMDGIAIII